MKIMFKCIYGSHLYGTNIVTSDKDYKGIFMPEIKNLILQNVAKSFNSTTSKNNIEKNTKDDVDCEIYSLHYFIKLALDGQTVALDMIHCPKEKTIITSEIWEFIKKNRAKFYTKNLKSYLGYCRTQASKYGIKGSRLRDCKIVLDFFNDNSKKGLFVKDVWDLLPVGENISKYNYDNCTQDDKRVYDVCSRKIMATCPIDKAIDTVYKFHKAYGERAKIAELSQGIDWKAIMHAFRAGFQLKEILKIGDLKYPLKDFEFLKKIRMGSFHYKNDGIGTMLDNLIEEIKELSDKSNLPEKSDKTFWEKWIISLYV